MLRPQSMPTILNIPEKLQPAIFGLNDWMVFLLEGGRGSGKSHSVARILLYLGEKRKLRIVCGREVQANIEESVYMLLKDLIAQYRLAYTVQARKIIHKTSGTVFTFKGFREQGQVSIKGLEGVDILWIDEAQSITKNTLDVIMPTMRKDTVKVFFTMNRFLREDAVPAYCASIPDECLHISINYFENPFCPLILKKQAWACKERSEKDYNHIWLGQPLTTSTDYLFNFDRLYDALKIKPFGELLLKQRVMGIDMAAQGDDFCVATVLDRASNQHWQVTERIRWDENDTMVSVGKIIDLIGRFKPDVTIIDKDGLGKPVYDRLNEVLGDGYKALYGFQGGSTAGIDTKSYANVRAAAYFTVKDWFDNGFLCIRETDRELVTELEKIKMKYRSSGARLIQPKVEMKKPPPVGLGFSPDNADSLMMAVWCAHMHLGSSSVSYGATSSKIVRESAARRGRTSRRSGRGRK
jgi:phage terminase large subunit